MATPKPSKLAVGALIEDMDLYPRQKIDRTHVNHIVEAIKAGHNLPPLVADRSSKRLIDGVQRRRSYLQVFGPDYEVSVVLKDYPSESEMLLDAIRLNSTHGNNLSTADRAHCRIKSEAMGIAIEKFCDAMHISIEKYGSYAMAFFGHEREPVPVKPAMQKLFKDKELTAKEMEVNDHLNGNHPIYFVNCLIGLLEIDGLDLCDVNLVQRLRRLQELLNAVKWE